MYRFLMSPKWLGFHLLVILGVVVMVNLGLWQLDRLDNRREFNSTVVARADLPARALSDLLPDLTATNDPGLAELEWRQATTQGVYLPDYEVLVINRSQNGRAGANLVTPLRLSNGSILLVNRGFVPLGVPLPPTPGGEINLRGLLRVSQERRTGQLTDPAEGVLAEMQRLDIDRISSQTPGRLLAMYLQLLESDPAEAPGLPEPVIRPDLSEGSHLSYAVQWMIFATAVGVGWVLAVRRSIAQRHRNPTASQLGHCELGHCELGHCEPAAVINSTTNVVTADRPSSAGVESSETRP
jgi:cytochrome oxidase assembly protein ShyY1